MLPLRLSPGSVHDEFAMTFQRKNPTAVGVNAPYTDT
jgi:hypothetical protein